MALIAVSWTILFVDLGCVHLRYLVSCRRRSASVHTMQLALSIRARLSDEGKAAHTNELSASE